MLQTLGGLEKMTRSEAGNRSNFSYMYIDISKRVAQAES